jgi:SAM-dependent methyltransferase
MANAEFDTHAATYRELHERNIAISGEEPEYFADYKMRDFQALTNEIGLGQDGRFLDFGAGIGASAGPFLRHMPNARLTCADVSFVSLSRCKEVYGDKVDYAQIENGLLPVEDGTFDGAFACCVFHHIPHDQHSQVLSELRRVVKPGGLLMVYEHNPFNPLTVRAVRTCPFDENAVLLTAKQLRRTAHAAGWRLHGSDYRVFFPASLASLRPLENSLRWLPLGAQYYVALRA